MGHQYRYPIPYDQYSYPQQQQQYQSQMPPAPSQQATNICQLCNSQGHYDYQCQFAGDFMAHTQKAFNQGRSYSHQDPNHGDILLKMKNMQPNFQEPVVEYCEPDQVIDICSYNHYPILDKSSQKQEQHNDDNDIYDTSELEHEFEYGIYERCV